MIKGLKKLIMATKVKLLLIVLFFLKYCQLAKLTIQIYNNLQFETISMIKK